MSRTASEELRKIERRTAATLLRRLQLMGNVNSHTGLLTPHLAYLSCQGHGILCGWFRKLQGVF